MTDTKECARAERADLAAFLATLDDEQWAAPTLCEGWSVHDVVAHLIGYDPLGVGGAMLAMVRSGFSLDRTNDRVLASMRDTPPAQLVELVRRYETPQGFTAIAGARIALLDAMIHQQDIRRPLGLPRTIPEERLVAALAFARLARPLGGPARVKGLRLVASDVAWAAGEGPEVRGPGEALLLSIGGRSAALDELSGPGRDTLAERFGFAS